MDRDPLIDQLVEGFASEARDICQRITNQLLALEHADTLDEAVRKRHFDDLARGLHTLKGNSDTFGFPQLAELAHRMEDVVVVYRGGLAAIPAEATDLLLRSTDVFMARLAARGVAEAEQPPIAELLEALQAAGKKPRPQAAPAGAAQSQPAAAASATALPVDEPGDSSLEDWRIGSRHVEALMHEIERLRELRLRLDERKREIGRCLRMLQSVTVRTPEVANVYEGLTSLSRAIKTDGEESGDVVTSLEMELKAVATLPLRWVVDPLHRAVRDLCRQLGKEAKLACVGAEISLDRRLLEALKGALVHLVRNAIDHGIETPEVRVAAGKHREGAITIRVERGGNMVFIDIEDDGAGIDPERVRRQALARGLLNAEEADQLPERELYQLLFRPGFSTRDEITSLSGRGVGLDVVRSAVQAQAGHVEVHTKPGSGTRFVLTVPAMLGSTPILVVRAGEQQLGVPLASVETIRAARIEDIQIGRTTSRFEYVGQLVPLTDLASLLGLREGISPAAGDPILIIKSRGSHVAISIDELIGDRELVVRPLPSELHDVAAYQGAATMARGDLLLILQPAFLVEGQPTAASASVRRALVVDDSLTARALHRTMLESGGYQVHTVSSARQALDHLRHAHYDIIVADVVMADIDGVQLTGMLRARRETRALPIILVSAHDTKPERERALVAGADAFLSKKDCVSGRLLAEVAQVIARRERVS